MAASNIKVANWILAGVNFGNIFLIVGGNLLVIVAVFRFHQLKKSATNLLIASLSVADLFVGVIFLPIKLANVFGYDGLVTEFLCDSVMTVSWTCLNSTIFSLLCVAVDRYRAIVTPTKRRISTTQAWLMILLTWTASFIYSSINIMISGITSRTIEVDGHNLTSRSCGYVKSEFDIGMLTIADFALLYCLPLLVIFCLYGKMIAALYFGNTPNDNSRRRKQRAVKMLVAVVVMFAISWFPYRVARILKSNVSSDSALFRFLRPLTEPLAMSNSWVNPLIYAIFGSNFRRVFAEILGCRSREGRRDTVNRSTARESRSTASMQLSSPSTATNLSDGTGEARLTEADSQRTIATQTEDPNPSDDHKNSEWYENLTFEMKE